MSPLERRYRRLLRWYPADHRAVHEDEMIGVLLADTGAGRERPDGRTVADLVLGGVRLHARRLFRGPRWDAALRAVSRIAPLLMLVSAGQAIGSALSAVASPIVPLDQLQDAVPGSYIAVWAATCLWAVVVGLAPTRARAAAGLAWCAVIAVAITERAAYHGWPDAWNALIGLLAATTLTYTARAGGGPALPGRHRFLVPAALLCAGVISALFSDPTGVDLYERWPWSADHPGGQAALVVLAALSVALLVRSPVARRAAALLVIAFAAGVAVSVVSLDGGITAGLALRTWYEAMAHAMPVVLGVTLVYGLYGLGRLVRLVPPEVSHE